MKSDALAQSQAKLTTLAHNLWWSWQTDGHAFWEDLFEEQWDACGHNPVFLVRDRFENLNLTGTQLSGVDSFYGRMQSYLGERNTWHADNGEPMRDTLAYFSAEYGIHESLPIYSGGLGILAGDHVKSASDLGLPFVAMGLLYRQGYVRQEIDGEGRQLAEYREYDFDALTTVEVVAENGVPLEVTVPVMGDECVVRVWQVAVGRVTLYLLDTDHASNPEHLRPITARLYGGGTETRIRQELILGVGGAKALRAMGIAPSVYHLNEGHSSFLNLERMRHLKARGEVDDLTQAIRAIRGSSVFTTHTPVEAGHDRFTAELAAEGLDWFGEAFGLDRQALLALGRWPDEGDTGAQFNMTLLALHTCDRLNGVAALHGEVSREMFARFWGGVPVDEVPITHVTNGVHAPSWQAPPLRQLLQEHLGQTYLERPKTDRCWLRSTELPAEALLDIRTEMKASLFELVRRREGARRERSGLPPLVDRLDPKALTIGFARRFATYKRADLLFSQLERLETILGAAQGPVQFLFAGKAHPADEPGQALIKRVYEASQSPTLNGRVILIEDYDIEVGRALVQGVDVWLNNPRRPKEASGTSGMKVGMNGGLNLSILDGWWPEGFNGSNGWAIGSTVAQPTPEEQDAFDASALYELLETAVIPTFYERGNDGLAHGWVDMMRSAIASVTPEFHSDRQVKDYVYHLYTSDGPA